MLFSRIMRVCFLFPGQGAQFPGMGKDLWDSSTSAREVFQRASRAAGVDLANLLFSGSAEDLQATDKTQIAITAMNVAASAALREKGVTPEGCAGFSLGEYAALHEAGVLPLEELFPIVKVRGELMESASRGLDSEAGRPGMAAVLGLSAEAVAKAVEPLAADGAFASNHNSPVQMVLSGTSEGLAKAENVLKAAGAKRVVRLKVSGPFHSPLLAEAAAKFGQELTKFHFADPRLPVYSNVTGTRITSGAEARELCAKQIVSPVRWVTVEQSLIADGFTRFFEVGPGTVLSGLFKALKPDADCVPAGRWDDVERVSLREHKQ